MANLYIITGPAGVGKSTVSRKIASLSKKSVLIEGDDIYHHVISSYTPAWKEGNHLEVFWKVCFETIKIYLNYGYDVVFNYIITPKNLDDIKNNFKGYNKKFAVLIVDEQTILQRDKTRPIDCQMKDRCLILLNNFKNYDFGEDYFLDSSSLTENETAEKILSDEKYNL